MIAQIEQKKYINDNRISPFRYKKEDMIFLNIENIVRARFNIKFNVKNIDFYKIVKIKFSLICQLKLPPSLRSFSLFYVNLLNKSAIDFMLTQRHQFKFSIINVDDEKN